ncbi:MAG: 50S ribosomal protein L25, partial [Pseudomonadota bacterium]
RVKKNQIITVEVTVNFLNEEASPGLKKGGALNVVRFAVELNVRADSIPDSLDADLTGLDIGDNVKISDINLPDGAEPTITDRDFTIASIVGRGIAADVEEEETDAPEADEVEATKQSDGDDAEE